MKLLAHVLRAIGFMALSVAHISLGGDNQKIQERLRIVIPIHIFRPDKDRHPDKERYPQTGQDISKDQSNKFSCELSGITWPKEKGSKLWHIDWPMTCGVYRGSKEIGNCDLCIPRQYSYYPRAQNPDPELFFRGTFACPKNLPDDFVRRLVKERRIINASPKMDFEFVLWNTEESLQQLDLLERKAVTELSAPVEARISVRGQATKSSLEYTLFGSIVIITVGFGVALWLVK